LESIIEIDLFKKQKLQLKIREKLLIFCQQKLVFLRKIYVNENSSENLKRFFVSLQFSKISYSYEILAILSIICSESFENVIN